MSQIALQYHIKDFIPIFASTSNKYVFVVEVHSGVGDDSTSMLGAWEFQRTDFLHIFLPHVNAEHCGHGWSV